MAKLVLVPVPIGNLEDITQRALRMLREANLILCEDTRETAHLLRHYDISNKLMSHHKFNEHATLEKTISIIQQHDLTVLVSDAGTPAISDPGFLVVRECVARGIETECLPGATAFVPALVNSGLPNERFCFEGFMPQKKGRKTRFESLKMETRTMIFYESPYRLLKTLEEARSYWGERKASVSRELTKMHEENARGTLTELIAHFSKKTIKGEIVIIIEGYNKNDVTEIDEVENDEVENNEE